jgi:hypothetical protein
MKAFLNKISKTIMCRLPAAPNNSDRRSFSS